MRRYGLFWNEVFPVFFVCFQGAKLILGRGNLREGQGLRIAIRQKQNIIKTFKKYIFCIIHSPPETLVHFETRLKKKNEVQFCFDLFLTHLEATIQLL